MLDHQLLHAIRPLFDGRFVVIYAPQVIVCLLKLIDRSSPCYNSMCLVRSRAYHLHSIGYRLAGACQPAWPLFHVLLCDSICYAGAYLACSLPFRPCCAAESLQCVPSFMHVYIHHSLTGILSLTCTWVTGLLSHGCWPDLCLSLPYVPLLSNSIGDACACLF